jgi:two-component system, chemotaxis family, chemotaxis protein CheY
MPGNGEAKRIVLVGHCGPDSYAIRSAVSRMVPGATVVLTMSDADLTRELPAADLLLINRQLDGDYAMETGVELIRSIMASAVGGAVRRPVVVLISNFPEAQSEAQAAGAAPGFGKRDLYSEEAKKRVRAALGLDPAPEPRP